MQMDKEIAQAAYEAAWKQSRGTESFSNRQEQAVASAFERWWERHGKTDRDDVIQISPDS